MINSAKPISPAQAFNGFRFALPIYNFYPTGKSPNSGASRREIADSFFGSGLI
jgi:hypothetical protein